MRSFDGPLDVGDRLTFVPVHACTCVNLADRLHAVRDGEVHAHHAGRRTRKDVMRSEHRPSSGYAVGETVLGMFAIDFYSTGLARTASSAGAEFIVFDQEHTGWGPDQIRTLLASAARCRASVPLVRVRTLDAHRSGASWRRARSA